MTPFQVCAELSEDHSQTEAWIASEHRRLKKQREIFQKVCFQQGIAAEHLSAIPLSELAAYVQEVAGGTVELPRLENGLREFLQGLG